jgi:hypothetical protein
MARELSSGTLRAPLPEVLQVSQNMRIAMHLGGLADLWECGVQISGKQLDGMAIAGDCARP